MANTFELIASSTVGSGGASSIDFTSIPSTYTDLVLKISARSNRSNLIDGIVMKFNGSSASYSERALEGSGSSAYSFSGSNSGLIYNQMDGNTATANTFANNEIYIPNYAGSTNKSVSTDYVTENNATAAYSGLAAGLWSNTAAITSISLTLQVGTLFQQYSTAYLYGVKNA